MPSRVSDQNPMSVMAQQLIQLPEMKSKEPRTAKWLSSRYHGVPAGLEAAWAVPPCQWKMHSGWGPLGPVPPSKHTCVPAHRMKD